MNTNDFPLEYNISGVPTLIFIKQEKEIGRIMGIISDYK